MKAQIFATFFRKSATLDRYSDIRGFTRIATAAGSQLVSSSMSKSIPAPRRPILLLAILAAAVIPFADRVGSSIVEAALWLRGSDEPTETDSAALVPVLHLVSDRPGSFSEREYADHVANLKQRLPSDQFHILVEPPFVIISDASPEQTQLGGARTVRWATRSLKQAFFAKDPEQILDIWLFKDKQSYELHNLRLFGSRPSTPYGYYSPTHKALVMNIATGGGTLVHEIVHPFIEANFPECPAWFNEGLGSLYEQSATRDGEIVGLTNWRLAGLQRAIERNALPSFGELCSTTQQEFYHADPGTNYAQARYLCYYLQEHELLKQFYRQFLANCDNDPTGYRTLQQVLGNPDMTTFHQQWQQFVLGLRFG